MAPETHQTGAIGAESSRTPDASTNVAPGETQQQCRHQLAHRDKANVATKNITLDAHLKMAPKTGSRKNNKLHAIRCESIHIDVDNGQLTM